MKILLACTSGGHLGEGLALFGDLPGTECVVLTEAGFRCASPMRVHTYRCSSGSSWLMMAAAFFRALQVIVAERPDWVVSTGAECGLAALIAAKILFRHTIFVETVTRYKDRTVAGRVSYRLADHFFVQHEESLALWGAKAKYIGGLF